MAKDTEDTKLRTPAQLWNEFLDYTSTTGIGNVLRWNVPLGKAFWYLITLAGFAGLLWQTSILALKYFKNEYNVGVRVEFNRSIPFPAVTICNQNPFRQMEVTKFQEEDPLFQDLFNDLGDETKKRKKRKKRNTVPAADEEADYNDYWENYEGNLDFYQYDEDYEDEEKIFEYIASLNQTVQKKLGHQLEAMLIDCNFQGKPCSIVNFTESSNYVYGNCYTLHQNKANGTKSFFPAAKSGPRFGLTMELFVELDQYIPDLSDGAGFRVVIHDQTTVPQPHEQGVNIPVGFYTSLGVRRFENRRLGGKYYNCSDPSTGGERNIWAKRIPNSYSIANCHLSCYQVNLARNCSCVDPAYPTEADGLPPGLKSCSSLGSDFANCQSDMEALRDAQELPSCDCLPSCLQGDKVSLNCKQFCLANTHGSKHGPNLSIYNTRSVNKAASHMAQENYMNNLQSTGKPALKAWFNKPMGNDSYNYVSLVDEVRYNVAKISIAFEDLNYEVVYQTVKYSDTQLISDLGGQMGLWLGFSVISLVEYIELLGLIIGHACCRLRKSPRKISDSMNTQNEKWPDNKKN